jgi:methyl-accepting chemotaxis protein
LVETVEAQFFGAILMSGKSATPMAAGSGEDSSFLSFLRAFSPRLTHKIGAIGIVGVAGVIVVGGMHMYGESEIALYLETADKSRAVFELSRKIEIELLESRRAEKDFLLHNEQKKAELYGEIAKAVVADINALNGKVQALGRVDLARKIEAMSSSLEECQAYFASVVAEKTRLGLDEKSGLEGSLRASVHDIEAKVNQLQNSDLLVTMLMMRRHEKDYMLRRDAKYGDEMKKRAAEFSAKVDKSDFPEVARAELKQKLADYQRDFFAWFNSAQKLAVELKATSDSFSEVEPVIAAVAKAVSEMRAEADQANMRMRDIADWQMKLAIVVIAFSVLGISVFIGRSVSRQLLAITGALGELAGGNFKVVLPGLGRTDEIGEMAGAAEVFRSALVETNRLRAEQSQAEQRQVQERKADMRRLADHFEAAVGQIIQSVSSSSTQLEASARTFTSSAVRSEELANRVAGASEEASSNVQSVASATEELYSSVNEIGRQVQQSARMAHEAVEQTRQTNDRVGELSKAASRIGDVVELINTIAGQTNLLALNATIEAARAGEAGRGFAVVASEVKALAEQTAKATGEIGHQISGIQTATQESVVAIQQISSTIEKLSQISSTIAAAVEEQGAATQEISRNVQQASRGTQQVSSNITDVQRGASETGSASSQVLSAAQSLSGDSNRLKLEVGKFLDTVRAA